jgi:toxin YoeB
MTVSFTSTGWEDYLFWQANDVATLDKINELIRDTKRDPFRGIGKPEPLSGNLKGWWSRRITREHRLVYKVEGSKPNQNLIIIQARFHY